MKPYLVLNAEIREAGKRSVIKELMKKSVVPGVVYLKGGKNLNISMGMKELNAIMNDPSGMTRIYEINVDGKKYECLLKEMQFNVRNDTPYHFDFMEVKKGDVVKISVPVRIMNKATCPGVKNGGDVYMLAYNVDLRCDVEKIPYAIEVDVGTSNVGAKFFLKDVVIPEGCKMIKNVILCRVAGKRVIADTETATADATATAEGATATATATTEVKPAEATASK